MEAAAVAFFKDIATKLSLNRFHNCHKTDFLNGEW
jgi:hypothetical protein